MCQALDLMLYSTKNVSSQNISQWKAMLSYNIFKVEIHIMNSFGVFPSNI